MIGDGALGIQAIVRHGGTGVLMMCLPFPETNRPIIVQLFINIEMKGIEMTIEMKIFANEELSPKAPHIHIRNTVNDAESYLNLLEPDYYYDHGEPAYLTREAIDDLKEFLESPCIHFKTMTNWEFLVYCWNSYNENYRIDCESNTLPDYSKLMSLEDYHKQVA